MFGDVNCTFIPNTKMFIIIFNNIPTNYKSKTDSVVNFTIVRITDNRERLLNNIYTIMNVTRLLTEG